MITYADLEIGLYHRDVDRYSVELCFTDPESDGEVRLTGRVPPSAEFDFGRLHELHVDDEAYGQLLSQSLFGDPAVATAFAQARSTAQAKDVPLRLRLVIGPSAPELHNLRWEMLRDPLDGSHLLTGEEILFSRYLSSPDWRPVGPRPRADLRALVVIANPAGLSDYKPGDRPLTPLDVEGELARAQLGLGDIPFTSLASGSTATLNKIGERFREVPPGNGGFDVLYLVCHGAMIEGQPHLWLENENGGVEVVSGDELVIRLRELRHRPRLVVLASCQSAGQGDESRSADEGALAALGPRLAEAGVPAVLAMQGNVTTETVSQFMSTFFRELQRDGQIDRAVAVARGAVRERPDWWMPVLFMRLTSGRLWYAPGFVDRHALERWPALLDNIRHGKCTPILGPGLTESLLGSRRQIARSWAEAHCYPLAPQACEELAQVSQFLAVNQDPIFPRRKLAEYARGEILDRYRDKLPEELHGASLNDLISAVGAQRRAQDPAEPHRVLAQLPLALYISATFDNLLAEALTEADKDPQVELCRWNEYVELLPSLYDREPDYLPDKDRPLVYHLFGHLQHLESIVLTEDDHFEYLIGVTSNKDLIPPVMRMHLINTALLFLGFRMDDWNFRVLFRSLINQEGHRLRSRYAHVAVQIDPEEGRAREPERARHYLESYFEAEHMSIYWGSVDDFVRELQQRLEGGAP
ncbi:MAG TPA: CHAT domain-containing protein [Anaerolineae bacterium]|nr:CHAT domain-containing protein [Anaerolineae bacterium]